MIDFAIARVSAGPDGPRVAVAAMCEKWPDTSGLQIVFALVSAAHAIERVFNGDASDHTEVGQTLRMTSLLAVDLFALQQRGNFAPTGRDLTRYWRDEDPFFIAPAA